MLYVVSEQELFSLRPVSFKIVERQTNDGINGEIVIGNTGGKYLWKKARDSFYQHFLPDGSNGPSIDLREQRQYATLYPAALFKFVEWHDQLPIDDPRKAISKIQGLTNITMSDFREKLLGEIYHQSNGGGEDRRFYEINIEELKANKQLIDRLKKYYERALKQNYKTINVMPEEGEMEIITIGPSDLKD